MPRRLLNVALVLLAALLVANAAAIAAPATPATLTDNVLMVANPANTPMAPNNYATMNGAINLEANTTADTPNAVAAIGTNNADEAAQDHNIGAPRKLPNQAANNLANNIAANARYRTPAKI